MNILLYAFSPFGKNSSNVSQQLLEMIPNFPGLTKHVFATAFDKDQFILILDRQKPSAIIGLGQYPTGDKLRIETTAHNIFGSKTRAVAMIDPTGPSVEKVTLRLSSTKNTLISDNAGRYVCNYSMYIVARWAKENKATFAFLHIPRSYDLSQAQTYLSQEIKNQL